MVNRGTGLSALVLAVGLAIPLSVGTGLAVVAVMRSPLESDASPQPLIATVGGDERLDTKATTVSWVPADTFAVRSQSAGTLTELSISSGTPVTHLSTPMKVDGLDVVAYVAPTPLYRNIQKGMEGQDVFTAQQLLMAEGLLSSADGKVGTATVRAITAFNVNHGRGKSETLDLAGLLWIPDGSGAPQSVQVRVGDVVQPQMDLYTTATSGDRIVVATDTTDVARIVKVAGVEVPLPAGTSSVSAPEDVLALRVAMADAPTVAAMLTATTPRKVGTVPASAVVVDETGKACFFRAVTGEGVAITAESGSFGLVDVDPELIGTPVLTDPRRTRADLSCD